MTRYKFKSNNKLKGAYGETDFVKRTITINKKRHKGKRHPGVRKNPDGSANLLDTIVHEMMHSKHPRMKEKTVRKKTPRVVKRLSKKQKKKLYSKFN